MLAFVGVYAHEGALPLPLVAGAGLRQVPVLQCAAGLSSQERSLNRGNMPFSFQGGRRLVRQTTRAWASHTKPGGAIQLQISCERMNQ